MAYGLRDFADVRTNYGAGHAPRKLPAVYQAGSRIGGQQKGNSPHRTPTIPNELALAKTALECAPTHSDGPQAWTTEPKVSGSNPLGRASEFVASPAKGDYLRVGGATQRAT
jgi:hypothetical protein